MISHLTALFDGMLFFNYYISVLRFPVLNFKTSSINITHKSTSEISKVELYILQPFLAYT